MPYKMYPIFQNRKRPGDFFGRFHYEHTQRPNVINSKSVEMPPMKKNFNIFSKPNPCPWPSIQEFQSFSSGANVTSKKSVGSIEKIRYDQVESANTTKKTTAFSRNRRYSEETNIYFFTVSIQTVKAAAKYRDRLHMIFAVFGIADSIVSKNCLNHSKTFQLQDATGNITCNFFEIDRKLPHLIRGQNYRCVGTPDKLGNFHCVSVRPATSTEQQYFQRMVSVSEKALHIKLALHLKPNSNKMSVP